jgi:Sulfotransferase family
MYALLASHPRIAMTRRTNWWTYFNGRFGDLSDDANLSRLLDTMLRYRRHRKLEPDRDRLWRDLRNGPPTYARLFALMEAHHAERLGRPRWGDKSLHTERYADIVFDEFPLATIIHMIRDPRDRYASVIKRWKRVRGGIGAGTAAWMGSVDVGERNAARFPDRYRVVRYEDLASAPEATMRAVCDLIGEPFVPEMLEMRGADTFREAGNSSYGTIPEGTISTKSIGRYRSVLRPEEIAFVEARAGAHMRRRGYELDAPRVNRIRYRLVDYPVNLAKMVGWRAREKAYDLTGRDPQTHTLVERDMG